jgi:formylmethanofuran dehydrogenase subunit B
VWPEDGLARAADTIAAARRVLVTGLVDATLESIAAACDLAEAVGAAIDAGAAECSRLAGPTIARIGEVTADWEELRDRSDLVIFWFCDPTTTHPRFLERFLTPATADALDRRTISIGPDAVLPAAAPHAHLPLPRTAAVDAARTLQLILSGHMPAGRGQDAEVCRRAADAIAAAACTAIVTRHASDSVGLEPWSMAGLVRSIAHGRQAFQVPLGAGIESGGGNAAGAAAVCTWRYGAPGGIARADRAGGAFQPGECDARRLIDRGEVDCVVAVGRLGPGLEEALAARREPLDVIRIDTHTEKHPATTPVATIHLRCASPLAAACGTMLREDGRRVVLGSAAEPADSMRAILAAVTARVRGMQAAGGSA